MADITSSAANKNKSIDFNVGLADISYRSSQDVATASLPKNETVMPSDAMMESHLTPILQSLSGGPSVNNQTFTALKPSVNTPALLLPQNSHAIESSIRAQLPTIINKLSPEDTNVGQAFLELMTKREDNQQLLTEYHNAIIGA